MNLESITVGSKQLKKKPKLFIVVVIAIILVFALSAIAAGVYLFAPSQDKSDAILESAIKAELGQLDGKKTEEIESELNRVISEGSMQIAISLNPQFPNGKEEGLLNIENSPANHYAQDISITLDSTGEEIYRSGLLMPNYHITKDKLLVDLPAGEYDCTALFTGYDTKLDNGSGQPVKVGTAAAKIKISILS